MQPVRAPAKPAPKKNTDDWDDDPAPAKSSGNSGIYLYFYAFYHFSQFFFYE